MRKSLSFEVGISEHCNLNCKGCSHFSPISPPYHMPLEQYRGDLRQLARVFGSRVRRISIMGGEPTLHPQLNAFLAETRSIFPACTIWLVTNGKTHRELSPDFWTVCRENRIVLSPTRYPCRIDYAGFRHLARSHGVRYRYMNGLKPIKKLKKFPFDLSGSQPPEESFRLCTQAGKCITLKNGRLYPCSTAAYADLFDRYFGEHFDYSEQDYVDIYKTADSAGILHRLSRPIPFCRYCGIPNIQRGLRWEISKKEKSEWV